MDSDDLKKRTRAFALRIIRLAESLPDTPTARVIRSQMLRCGSSVGANYRAACRAKSKPDFISKMGIVEEAADETIYWMELLIDAKVVEPGKIANLLSEANEIVSMVVTSINTARGFKRPIRNPHSSIRNQ
ncbi:MAG TPA: four helix bundle protein [Pyrinomonadaceae bacterium]